MAVPAVEAFLAGFHDARPGLTSKRMADLAVTFRGETHGSSYEVLALAVPRAEPGGEVLDLACGDGYLLSLLAARSQAGLALHGADMSAGELAAARQRLGDRATLVEARAQDQPFEDGRFDCVLCHMALMLMDDTAQVLREVRRILKPGGRFAAVVGAPPPASPAAMHYRNALARHARDEKWSTVRFGDPRVRSSDGIVELLAQAFQDVAVEDMQAGARFTPPELWSWFLDMYDLYLLPEADRSAVERELLQAIAPDLGEDGKIDLPMALRYLEGVAATRD